MWLLYRPRVRASSVGHVFDIWASFINFQLHVVQEKNRHANICVKCCGVRPTSAASKSRKATTIQSTSRCSFADSHIHSCCFFFCRSLRQPLHLSLSLHSVFLVLLFLTQLCSFALFLLLFSVTATVRQTICCFVIKQWRQSSVDSLTALYILQIPFYKFMITRRHRMIRKWGAMEVLACHTEGSGF